MKVLIELDLDDPNHWLLLQALHNTPTELKPDTRTVAEDLTTAAEPAPKAEVKPAAQPEKVDPSPCKDEVNRMFAELYAVKPEVARDLAADFRSRFTPDSDNWTEEQLKEADTKLQAQLKL